MKKPANRTRGNPESEGIPVDSPNAPIEDTDAGDSSDLSNSYVTGTIRRYRAQANRHFAAAKRLVGHDRPGAENEARQAIDSAVRAFWWAEDSEIEEAQHELMHRIGCWTRKNFNCHLGFDEEGYYRECPLDIAHTRVGMSIGFIANRVCSLCGNDLSECPHMPGRAYWERGGAGPTGKCRVCREASCHHRPDRLYRAQVVSIVESGKLREISFVPRPANPEARLTRIPVPTEDLAEALGPSFMRGITVSCDKCLGPCPGFSDLGDDLEEREIELIQEQSP
jgi:hypothetical protein